MKSSRTLSLLTIAAWIIWGTAVAPGICSPKKPSLDVDEYLVPWKIEVLQTEAIEDTKQRIHKCVLVRQANLQESADRNEVYVGLLDENRLTNAYRLTCVFQLRVIALDDDWTGSGESPTVICAWDGFHYLYYWFAVNQAGYLVPLLQLNGNDSSLAPSSFRKDGFVAVDCVSRQLRGISISNSRVAPDGLIGRDGIFRVLFSADLESCKLLFAGTATGLNYATQDVSVIDDCCFKALSYIPEVAVIME